MDKNRPVYVCARVRRLGRKEQGMQQYGEINIGYDSTNKDILWSVVTENDARELRNTAKNDIIKYNK